MEQFSGKRGKNEFSYVRFIILAVSTLFLSFVLASVMAFNTTYVVMCNTTASPLNSQYERLMNQSASATIAFDWAPGYLSLAHQRFSFNAVQRSFSFAGPFAGGLIGTFPMLYVLRRLGAHKTMFIIGLLSSLICALTPQAISMSFELFIVLRFISGFITAPLFPVLGTIIEDWATMDEKGLFMGVLSAHLEIAPLFTLPVAAMIAENINWPTVFYVHGLLCALFTVAWLVFYRNDPADHWLISFKEVETIKWGKHHGDARMASPPYCAVLSSPAVWSIFAAAIGTVFVGQFMGVFSPQYFTSVLGYSPTLTGTLAIIPIIAALPVKFLTGIVSDRMSVMSEIAKVRLFNSLASFLGAFFLVLVLFISPSTNLTAATTLIMIPFIMIPFTTGGFQKAALLVARQHAPAVFSVIHIFAMITLLTGTFIIPLLTPDNTFDQWKLVFLIFIVILVISNVIFIIFVSAEPAEWAERKMEFVQLSE
ncbi:hypothetical protein PFISCL1PPCAC_9512, partial [Pristionchus fissidentatus]